MAVSAYLQSSLHGSELPGQAALHFLIPMLEKAEKEGRIDGNITVVPQANPIGSAQWQAHQHLGRFDYSSPASISTALSRCSNPSIPRRSRRSMRRNLWRSG